MIYDSDLVEQRYKVEVQVEFADGTRLLGALFVKPLQRVSDLLNDLRQFLPLQTSGGIVVHLAKSSIARVTQLDQTIDTDEATDPYVVLNVPQDISDEDLKFTYHRLCGEHHPDKLLSLNLSDEYIELANSRMSRIIDAYARIVNTRHGEAGNGQNGRNDKPSASPFS